ncbi:hypothetical protein [Neorhizobium petrolearium]|uniref:hypothetical protein n=1 Tax=Neorhizobium petrolearium TaxID=515361 RepID=UPI003F136D0F
MLGAIIPDLDYVVAAEQQNLPTPAKPTLPLHMRSTLLAGISIVARAEPEMLPMLRGHMMGDNRVRFTEIIERMITQPRRSNASSQMQCRRRWVPLCRHHRKTSRPPTDFSRERATAFGSALPTRAKKQVNITIIAIDALGIQLVFWGGIFTGNRGAI